jgi:hypothetical protein
MNRVLHRARETYLQDDIDGFKLIKAYEMKINEMGGHALLEVTTVSENNFKKAFGKKRRFNCIKWQLVILELNTINSETKWKVSTRMELKCWNGLMKGNRVVGVVLYLESQDMV